MASLHEMVLVSFPAVLLRWAFVTALLKGKLSPE